MHLLEQKYIASPESEVLTTKEQLRLCEKIYQANPNLWPWHLPKKKEEINFRCDISVLQTPQNFSSLLFHDKNPQ